MQDYLDNNLVDIHFFDYGSFLQLVIENEKNEIIKEILKRSNLSVADSHSVIRGVILKNYIEIFKFMLGEDFVDVNADDCSYYYGTLLNNTIVERKNEILDILLQHPKIDVNKRANTDYGFMPLEVAVNYDNQYALKKLLTHKDIDVNAVYNNHKKCIPRSIYDSELRRIIERLFENCSNTDVNLENKYNDLPLNQAIRSQNISNIKWLLQYKNTDINKPESKGFGNTPLIIALHQGNISIIKLLIKHKGEQFDFLNKSYERDRLIKIVGNDSVNVIDELLTDSDLYNEGQWQIATPLIDAVNKGDTEHVKELLASNEIDVNGKDADGNTALVSALNNGNDLIAEILINDSRVNVNKDSSRLEDTNFPFYLALKNSLKKSVIALLKRADLFLGNFKPKYSAPPDLIELAIKNNFMDEAEMMLARNDVNVKEWETSFLSEILDKGYTSFVIKKLLLNDRRSKKINSNNLQYVMENSCQTYEKFIEKVLDIPEIKNKSVKLDMGISPLCDVVKSSCLLKKLLSLNEFDVNEKIRPKYYEAFSYQGMDSNHPTTLHIACKFGYIESTKTLLDLPEIQVNIKDKHGNTPLHSAVNNGKVEAVKLLLSHHSIDVNVKNNEGNTPLHEAIKEGSLEIVQLLLEHKDIDFTIKNWNNRTPLQLAQKLLKELETLSKREKEKVTNLPLIIQLLESKDPYPKQLYDSEKLHLITLQNNPRRHSFEDISTGYSSLSTQNTIMEEKVEEEKKAPEGKDKTKKQTTTEKFLANCLKNLPENDQKTFKQTITPIVNSKLPKLEPKQQQQIADYFQKNPIYPEVFYAYSAENWVAESCKMDIIYNNIHATGPETIEKFSKLTQNITKDYTTCQEQEKLFKALKTRSKDGSSLETICTALEYAQIANKNHTLYYIEQIQNENWLNNLKTLWIQKQTELNLNNLAPPQQNNLSRLLSQTKYSPTSIVSLLNKAKSSGNYDEIVTFLTSIVQSKIHEQVAISILGASPNITQANKVLQFSIIKEKLTKLVPSYAQEKIESKILQLINLAKNAQIAQNMLNGLLQNTNNKSLTSDQVDKLGICLDNLLEYRVAPNSINRAVDTFTNASSYNWESKIHQIIIEDTFLAAHERTLDEVVDYIAQKSPYTSFANDKSAQKNAYNAIKSAYDDTSKILTSNTKKISSWTKDEVTEWAKYFKENVKNYPESVKTELLAVVQRAVVLQNKFPPRATQMLSILTLLNANSSKGRLAQINTGEGKSLIVAMLAAIFALQNKKVDVITTSPELSIPEVEKQTPFFEMLGLTSGENSGHDFPKKKGIYESDIVYGTASDFQGDILRCEFMGMKIRGDRGFDTVIVDEVDSMLFDDRTHSIRLSGQTPAMHHLEIALASVWNNVGLIGRRMIEKDGKIYFMNEDFEANGDQIKLFSGNNPGDCMKEITDREAFITEQAKKHLCKILRTPSYSECERYNEYKRLNERVSVLANKLAIGDDAETLRANIRSAKNDSGGIWAGIGTAVYEILLKKRERQESNYQSAIKQLQSCAWLNEYPLLPIPNHLREFTQDQIENWIHSAIMALFVYKKELHYDVKGGKIIPIDYHNTGVLQENMVWSDGLAQMLQIKEGLKIDPENISTNSLSTATYFHRYSSSLYGLTGTIGNESTQGFFADVYNTDMVVIPPYKMRPIAGNEDSKYVCKELPAIVVPTESEWQDAIINTNLSKLRNNRAVLIICKYIDQVKQIANKLRSYHQSNKVFTYTGQEKFYKHDIGAGEVIVATNIAGRGTDLTTSDEVERNGGMHVCITFLPDSYRVELQNSGRTARQGKKGSAQLIIQHHNVPSIEALRAARDKIEAESINSAKKDVTNIVFKDKLFSRFCDLENDKLPVGDEELRNSLNYWDRKGAEERWGFWLQMNLHDKKALDQSSANSRYGNFSSNLGSAIDNDRVIVNPYFYVCKGNDYVISKEYDKAVSCYDRAIDLDPHFSANARYNKARAIFTKKDNKNDLSIALKELKRAKAILLAHNKPDLLSINALVASSGAKPKLCEHLQHQIDVISQQESYINAAITEIKEARSKGWDVELKSVSMMDAFGSDYSSHEDAIDKAYVNGLTKFFTVSAKEPTNWFGVITVALLGIVQIAAGVLTMATTGGLFGVGLIQEGVSDLITALKSTITGKFSWAEWSLQKSISFAISLISAGWTAFKDGCSSLFAGVKTAVTSATTVLTREGLKIAMQQVALEIGKGVAKECVKELANYAIDSTVIADIERDLAKRVQGQITRSLEGNELVMKGLALDQKNKSNQWQQAIIKEGMDLLRENQDVLRTFFTEITKGVASSKIDSASKFFQAAGAGQAIYKLNTYTDEFIIKLNDRISTKYKGLIEHETEVMKQVEASEVGENKANVAPALSLTYCRPSDIPTISDFFTSQITGKLTGGIKGSITNPIAGGIAGMSVDVMTRGAQESINGAWANLRGKGQTFNLDGVMPKQKVVEEKMEEKVIKKSPPPEKSIKVVKEVIEEEKKGSKPGNVDTEKKTDKICKTSLNQQLDDIKRKLTGRMEMGNNGSIDEINVKLLRMGIMPKGMLVGSKRRSVSPMSRMIMGDGGKGVGFGFVREGKNQYKFESEIKSKQIVEKPKSAAEITKERIQNLEERKQNLSRIDALEMQKKTIDEKFKELENKEKNSGLNKIILTEVTILNKEKTKIEDEKNLLIKSAHSKTIEKANNIVKDICSSHGFEKATCNFSVRRMFYELTGNDSLNNFMANDMCKYFPTSLEWEEIPGPAGVQKLANELKIVIACKPEFGVKSSGLSRHGHVVMVLPGEEVYSEEDWKEMVPIVIDTGENRRRVGWELGKSWSIRAKKEVKYYLYKGPIKLKK